MVFLGSPDVAAQVGAGPGVHSRSQGCIKKPPSCPQVLSQLVEASRQPDASFEVSAVVTQPPRPKGRGLKLQPTAVEKLARDMGFGSDQILVPEKANEAPFLEELGSLSPDLCITAAYGNFLPQRFLDIPRFGTLNIHPSLLPRYRGAAPVPRAIEAGDEVQGEVPSLPRRRPQQERRDPGPLASAGVCVLFTVLKMDAGPVLAREEVRVDPNIQAPELLSDLFRRGTGLLLDRLPLVWAGRGLEVASPQDEAQATHAAKISREETLLDPGRPARVGRRVAWRGVDR